MELALFHLLDVTKLQHDPEKGEAAITKPLPLYLYMCTVNNDTERIKENCRQVRIGNIRAAHAFGEGAEIILEAGDMATLSFHATKTQHH